MDKYRKRRIWQNGRKQMANDMVKSRILEGDW